MGFSHKGELHVCLDYGNHGRIDQCAIYHMVAWTSLSRLKVD